MKKLAFIAIALSVVSQGALAEWTKLHESIDITYFIDRSSIKRVQDGYRAWFLVSYKHPQPLGNGSFQSYMARDEYNCKDETSKTLDAVFFKGPNGKGAHETMKFDDEETDLAVPNTLAGAIIKGLCRQ